MKIVEDNVEILQGVTSLSIPVERVLQAALDTELSSVVIFGEYEDGTEYFCSTDADGPEVLWKIERAKYKLLKIMDPQQDI